MNATSNDGTPWIANSGGGVPASVNTSGAGVSVRTSVETWRDYSTRAATMTFDAAPAGTPAQIALPKPAVTRKTPLDVWSNVDVNGYEGARDQSVRAGAGADLAVAHTAVIGLSVERGDARSEGAALSAQDSKMSAYVTLQAAPMLSVEARSDWQAGNAEFAAAQGASKKNSVSFSPRLDHSFALGGGATIEPFVRYTHQFDTSAVSREAEAVTQSAGAGITYTAPDAYSLSVTTDMQGVGAKEPESLSSKLQLSLPIK